MRKYTSLKKSPNKTKSLSIRVTEELYLNITKRIFMLDYCDGITDYLKTLVEEDLKKSGIIR